MVKHSKHNRRRMHQGGFGGGFTVVRQVPIRVQRTLPNAPTLSPEPRYRLKCLEHAKGKGRLMTVYRNRFAPETERTLVAWLATGPLNNPDAPTVLFFARLATKIG